MLDFETFDSAETKEPPKQYQQQPPQQQAATPPAWANFKLSPGSSSTAAANDLAGLSFDVPAAKPEPVRRSDIGVKSLKLIQQVHQSIPEPVADPFAEISVPKVFS